MRKPRTYSIFDETCYESFALTTGESPVFFQEGQQREERSRQEAIEVLLEARRSASDGDVTIRRVA